MFSLYECIRAQARCVSLQGDVARYWPGAHNSAILYIFMDFLKQGSFLPLLLSACETAQKPKAKLLQFLGISLRLLLSASAT